MAVQPGIQSRFDRFMSSLGGSSYGNQAGQMENQFDRRYKHYYNTMNSTFIADDLVALKKRAIEEYERDKPRMADWNIQAW